MSSAVASAMVSSDPMHSPMTARKRIGSNGSSIPDGRAAGVACGSVTLSIVGVRGRGGGISAGVRLAGGGGLFLAGPTPQHHAGARRRGLGAEPVVLDGDGEDDRAA